VPTGRHARAARGDRVRIAAGRLTRQLHELRDLITGAASTWCSRTPRWSAASRDSSGVAILAQEHHLTFNATHLDQRHGRDRPTRTLVAGSPTHRSWSFPSIRRVEPRAARLHAGRTLTPTRRADQPSQRHPGWARRSMRGGCSRRASLKPRCRAMAAPPQGAPGDPGTSRSAASAGGCGTDLLPHLPLARRDDYPLVW